MSFSGLLHLLCFSSPSPQLYFSHDTIWRRFLSFFLHERQHMLRGAVVHALILLLLLSYHSIHLVSSSQALATLSVVYSTRLHPLTNIESDTNPCRKKCRYLSERHTQMFSRSDRRTGRQTDRQTDGLTGAVGSPDLIRSADTYVWRARAPARARKLVC